MKQKYLCGGECPERLGKVGGQAVLEGVMMKAGSHTVTTCRKPDKTLAVVESEFVSVRKKYKILNLPLIRGVVNFVEMMKLSFSTLEASADAMGMEEEETKFETWLKKHLGVGLTDVAMVIGTVLGIALSLFLFMFLPTLCADLINGWVGGRLGVYRALVEGGCKVLIFLVYLWLISLLPDIRRTFMYHGAEHKSIACFEAGVELTPANAKQYTRFHPRCGTSFMFFMILIGIIVGIFIRSLLPGLSTWMYVAIRLLLLPLVVGIGYEFIMFAGKHDNILVRMLSAPGLWVQRITTKEPTEDMLECAIVSLKCAMRDKIPEFRAFYDEKPWEPKPVAPAEENLEDAATLAPAEDVTDTAEETSEADAEPEKAENA